MRVRSTVDDVKLLLWGKGKEDGLFSFLLYIKKYMYKNQGSVILLIKDKFLLYFHFDTYNTLNHNN